jgi:hypothetical protein
MKKLSLFFMAVWLLYVAGYSQTLQIVPPGAPAPKGMVNVTLQVGANIPDSNGYIMFLDPTASTYGTVFPAYGYIAYSCELPAGFLDAFPFKIPVDAESTCTTPHIVFNNSITIQITSGTYDYIIAYPMPNNGYWAAAANPNGRQEDYVFEEGYHYTFAIDYNPYQTVDIIITEDLPDPSTPAAVSDSIITPDGADDLTAALSWLNPTENSGGEALAELTAVKVYQNFSATPIYTNTNPVIGGAESVTITVPEPGRYFYMVVGENSAGVGAANTVSTLFCNKISSFPYEEGFETSTGTSFPVCWEQEFVSGTRRWEALPFYQGTPGTAHEGTKKAYFFSTIRGEKTKLVTAPIDLSSVEHPLLNFWHTQRMWYQDLDKLRIFYKNSYDGEWNLLVEYLTEVYDWTERNIALPNKSSDYYIAFEGEAQYAHGVQLDDISIMDMEGTDGAAIQLFGVTAPMVNEPYIYKAQIMNMAGETLSGYTVKLIDDQNNVLDVNDEGDDIASMESKMISLHYTPTTTGTQSLRAVFEMTGDINPENDKTPFLNINVLPHAETFTATIGTDNLLSDILPFNYDYDFSRVQSLYFVHEIINRPGAITQLQYFNNFETNFTGQNTKTLKIWMANTTVDKLNTWLPESEFTLVWDAPIPIPAGQNTITITLPVPYIYEGQNLVIMTNKSNPSPPYINNNPFFISETSEFDSRSREYHNFTYDFQWYYPGNALNYFPNTKMGFGLEGATVTGKVTSDGTTPLEGVTVELIGPNASHYFKRTTDANGDYSFDFLLNGNYQFKATKLGHYDVISNPVSIEINNNYIVDITLPHLPTFSLSGKITANDAPDGLPGTEVKLTGYYTYSAMADETGNYTIPSIYATKIYNIEASKEGYVSYLSTVSINDQNVTRDISLNEIAWNVGKPLVDIVNDNAVVTWMMPGTFTERSYILDDGTVQDGYYIYENANNWLGNKFVVDEEGELTGVDLFGFEAPNNTDKWLTIDIFDENRQFAGTSEPFILKANEWVNVPLGNIPYSGTFYAMVHWEATPGYSHGLGYNTSSPHADEYLDMYLTQDGEWSVLHQLLWADPGVFMIRAYANIFGKKVAYREYERTAQPAIFSQTTDIQNIGRITGTIVAPECVKPKSGEQTRSFEKYMVYRLTENQPESEWVLLSDNVIELTYTDYDWDDLPSGVYQYAVKVKYTGDVISIPKLTNKVMNKMAFDYQVNITSNSGDPVAGAIVTLTHQDGSPAHIYTAVSGATGVTFPNAWIGTYNLKITLNGHQDYSATITISDAGQSHTATLIEIINMPYALEIDVDCEEKKVLFGWNNFQPFFDDMESYPDFIAENIGDYTLYYFNDSFTYGVGGVSYPNMFLPHAFQVFNPLRTNPPMNTPNAAPHSGEKYLVSFAKMYGANDDWLILPKMRITDNVTFSFWARAYSLEYPERIRVLVSTTGVNAPGDFKLLSEGNYIDLPEVWTYYSFNLSEYARQEIHLAINCVSDDGFFMMLDDISVDIDRGGSKSLTGYRVYLDDEVMETTTNTEYLFTNIGEGIFTAGVKAIYSSGESQMATIQFEGCEEEDEEGIDETNPLNLKLFPNPFTNEIHINHPDLVNSVQIMDIMGQTVKNTIYNGKTISTESLSSGVYMIIITTHSGERKNYTMVKK